MPSYNVLDQQRQANNANNNNNQDDNQNEAVRIWSSPSPVTLAAAA